MAAGGGEYANTSTPMHRTAPIHASKVGFSIRPRGDMKVTLCRLSTMPARAGPRWHAQKRGAGSGIPSLGAGSSEMARNQIRVRRGIVVSCLQQAALFALDYDCVPRIDHDRRNDRRTARARRTSSPASRLARLAARSSPTHLLKIDLLLIKKGERIDHLRRYVELLFQSAKRKGKETP
jgi:hypothetical protein